MLTLDVMYIRNHGVCGIVQNCIVHYHLIPLFAGYTFSS